MDLKVLTRALLAATLLLVTAGIASADMFERLRGDKKASFVSTRPLPVDKAGAVDLAAEALEVIGIDHVRPDLGRVESKYYRHKVGPSRFRTRVTAVVTRRNEGTVVEVRAQRELLLEALNPGVYQGGARWQMVGSHDAVAADIVERIEKAAGVWVDPEEAAMQEAAAKALEAAGGVPAASQAPVAASAWNEIQALKTERRDLLAPIRSLDEEALAIVYSEDLEERRQELQRIRDERNRLWEEARPRIMQIDKQILQLVLEE